MSDDFNPEEFLRGSSKPTEEAFDPESFLGKKQEFQAPKATWAEKNIIEPVKSGYKNLVGAVRDMPSPATKIPIAGPVIDYLTSLGASAVTPQTYAQTQAQSEEKQRNYATQHPMADFNLSLAGAMAVPGTQGKVAAEGAGLLSKAGTGLYNAAERTAGNSAMSGLDAAVRGEDPGEAAMSTAKSTGKIEAGLLAGKGAARLAGPVIFGVANKAGDYYRKNRDAVNSASELGTKQNLDEAVGHLKGMADETGVAEAEARGNKSAADRQLTNDLKQANIPEGMPDDITSARKTLRGQISKASGDQFDLLQQKEATIALPKVKAFVTQKLNDLNIAGSAPPPGSAEAAGYKKLADYREWLNGLPKDMRPEDMKRLVQNLDSELDAVYSAGGGYVSKGDRALGDIRTFIDDEIKTQHPDYAEGMKSVADKTKLAKSLDDYFSNDKSSTRSLKNLDAQENIKARESLDRLGKETGNDFIKPLGEYENSKRALKDPQTLDFIKSGLPETSQLAEAQANSKMASDLYDPARRAGPMSTQNIMKSVGGKPGKNIENEKLLDYLSQTSGQDFRKQGQDLGVQRAFQGGFQNGSRNVNLHAMSLAGIVSMLAHGAQATELPGVKGAGAVSGAIMDKFGPQMYKGILDMIDQPAFQRYAPMLKAALQRSPVAFATTAHLLSKKDPNFERLYNQSQGGEGQ